VARAGRAARFLWTRTTATPPTSDYQRRDGRFHQPGLAECAAVAGACCSFGCCIACVRLDWRSQHADDACGDKQRRDPRRTPAVQDLIGDALGSAARPCSPRLAGVTLETGLGPAHVCSDRANPRPGCRLHSLHNSPRPRAGQRPLGRARRSAAVRGRDILVRWNRKKNAARPLQARYRRFALPPALRASLRRRWGIAVVGAFEVLCSRCGPCAAVAFLRRLKSG